MKSPSPSSSGGVGAPSSYAAFMSNPSMHQMMLSKDEAEAQRAIKKLNLNHSSKMLVQDQ